MFLIPIAMAYYGVVHWSLIMFVGLYVAIIFFFIWTITVAKNARQEILEEDGQGEVQEMK